MSSLYRGQTSLREIEHELQSQIDLEKTVVQQRSDALRRQVLKLARQRAFLREERKRSREISSALEAEKKEMGHVKREDWWPTEHLTGVGDPSSRLRLRVGGHLFEVSKKVLSQDSGSLLAALCEDGCPASSPHAQDDDGAYEEDGRGGGGGGVVRQDKQWTAERVVVLDRDWWLFRYVLAFLRDGTVPENRTTALRLYREASFWKLEMLQRAIEESHLDLTRTEIKTTTDGGLEKVTLKDKQKFWKNKTNWWESQPEIVEVEKVVKEEPPPEPSWWYSSSEVAAADDLTAFVTSYNDVTFGPLSTEVDKVTTGAKDDDIKPMTQTTWGYE